MNTCIMMGRLTRDPEVRYAKNEEQTAVVSFSIAVNRPVRKGEEKEADFFRCVCFGWLAEFAADHLYKGIRVCVSGRLQNESFENRDGETVRYDQLILREIHFADGKANETGKEEAPQAAAGDGKSMGSSAGQGSRNGSGTGNSSTGKKNGTGSAGSKSSPGNSTGSRRGTQGSGTGNRNGSGTGGSSAGNGSYQQRQQAADDTFLEYDEGEELPFN